MYTLKPTVAALVAITPLIVLITYLDVRTTHLEPLQLLTYLSAILATNFLFVMDELIEEYP